MLQAANLLVQVVGIPLFLKHWGIDYYGEWIILFTIPGYIAVSDLGLGTAATTEMSMMAEKGESAKIEYLLRNSFWFIVIFGSIPFILLAISVFILPWYEWLGFVKIDLYEFRYSFLLLIAYVYISIFLSLPINYYRVEKKYYRERFISTVFKLIEFGTIAFCLYMGYGAFAVAAAFLFWRIALLAFVLIDLNRISKIFKLLPFSTDIKEVQGILKPGLSLIGFFLGQSLMSQGIVTVIGITLGSSMVVVFNTIRILINLVKQLIGTLNQAIFAEFSYAKGSENGYLLYTLFMVGLFINLCVSLVSCLLLWGWGQEIIKWWTGQQIVVDRVFLNLMIFYTLMGAMSAYALTFVGAVNRFKQLTVKYIALTVGTLFLAIFSNNLGGLRYIAGLLGIFELILFILTVRICLEILERKFKALYKFRQVDWQVFRLKE